MQFELTDEGRKTLKPFVVFAKHHLASDDIDPLYPVLRHLQKGMGDEQALWHSYLYVAWYNLPSATVVFDEVPEPSYDILSFLESVHFPTGVERRNHRGGRVNQHIESYLDALSEHQGIIDQRSWYLRGTEELEDRHERWEQVNANFREVWGNGRWAGYKMCEVLRRVNGFEIEAPDMGNQFSSGPRKGLQRFYGDIEGEGSEAIETLDAMGLDLQSRLQRFDLDVDIEHLETLLCDWNSVSKGHYYVGHDHDLLHEQIERARFDGWLSDEQAERIYEARKASCPHEYLAELNDWHGVDQRRKKHFVKTGRIAVRSRLD